MSLKDKKKRSLKAWSLEEKLAAVARVRAGESITGVARNIGASPASVCEWKKIEGKLREGFAMRRQQRVFLLSRYEQMEEALLFWFQQLRKENLPISGQMVQDKARKIYNSLPAPSSSAKSESFTASSAWLSRFEVRHGLHLASEQEENVSTNMALAETFKEKFARCVSEYTPDQVYNADETGLFWKKMPNRMFISKEESVAEFKASKERLSLLLCANAVGTDKLKPVVVGNVKCPSAFNKVSISHLPVLWRYNSKARMVQTLFDDWFLHTFIPHVKEFLHSKNLAEKAVLVVDNATAHCHGIVEYSKNFKVIFLPAHTTTFLQPMDQGIIENFKRFYTRNIFHRLALAGEQADAVRRLWQNYTLKKAVYDISHAWDEISQSCLNGAWRKLWPQCSPLSDEDSVWQVSTQELVAFANDVSGSEKNPLAAEDIEEHIESHRKEFGAEDVAHLAVQSEELEDDYSSDLKSASVAKLKSILSLLIQLQDTVADYDLCIERRDGTLKELKLLESQYYQVYNDKKIIESKDDNFFPVYCSQLVERAPSPSLSL
uniref:tigger transposable element-derived protein 1-like n=1 Tax=Myxine glutinosa TaxID=7769 RepID=UPI0035901B18